MTYTLIIVTLYDLFTVDYGLSGLNEIRLWPDKIVMQIVFVSLLVKNGNIVSFHIMLSIVGASN